MGPKFLQQHTWGTRENITEITATKPRELWTVEVGNCYFFISSANGAKRGEKGATECEITTLSEKHSSQKHTCPHQQTAETIIRAQTLTQRGFPWMTTLKFHSEQSGCQREMCIKIPLGQAQADWAVLQVLVTEMHFLHMASAQVFLQHPFYAQLAELHLTHRCTAEHPFLSSFCSVPFVLSRNVQAQLSKNLSASLSHVAGISSCLSSHIRSWAFQVLCSMIQLFFTVFTGLG